MVKLKRKSDGVVLDCAIIEGRINNWDADTGVGLFAVFYCGGSSKIWEKEPLNNFEPAVPGVDF